MTVTTEKIVDAVAARIGAARHLAESRAAKTHAHVEKGRAKADKAKAKADKAQAKLAGKAMLEKMAVKAGMAKAATDMPASRAIGKRMEHVSETARTASQEATKQLQQARAMVQEHVIPTVAPMAAAMMDQASHRIDEIMAASEPARREAVRRGILAAAVLRGAEPVVKKRRRWPIALLSMALGGLIGAAAAWLSQAGKPVQLTPYPIPAEDGDRTVDLTSEESQDSARHES